MTREEAYDMLVQPLMTQIINLCYQHEIPLLASFDLGDQSCTTAVWQNAWNPNPRLELACDIIYPEKAGKSS